MPLRRFGLPLIMRIMLSALALVSCARKAPAPPPGPPPNIVFCIADDASWAHFGAYGDPVARTPNFDRIAREGAVFTNAYCSSPSCTPSRGAILTGQDFWRLGEGGNLWSYWPNREPVYPDLLEAAGYKIGLQGKGWSPGEPTKHGRKNNPAGPNTKDFGQFVREAAGGPFCYWYGSANPHRPYGVGSGAGKGLKPEQVVLPPFIPDTPETRGDMLDYYAEIEAFDNEIGKLVAVLESAGALDNTIFVITSDNGFPFPRGKTNLYDYGVRMPLVIRYPPRIKPGTVIHDFVSHTDLAPTFLAAAGVEVPAVMTGRSLWPELEAQEFGRFRLRRDRVVFGRERHARVREGDIGYPMRAIRTADYLYIRNFEPSRWPSGDPPVYGDLDPSNAIEGSPTKKVLIEGANANDRMRLLFNLALDKRPAEELYDLLNDPFQMANFAGERKYERALGKMREQLQAYLSKTSDPRVTGGGELFDTYPRFDPSGRKQAPRPASR